MNILDLLSFIGFLFLAPCVIVGAYIILRWGYCGICLLWSIRRPLDEAVTHNASHTWGIRD